jgi:hypothetical protein
MCARCTTQYQEDIERVHEAMHLHNKWSVEEIAAYAALSPVEVRRIMDEPVLIEKNEEVNSLPPCVRCRNRPSQRDSQFCLVCRLELNKAFGEAARTLAQQIERDLTERRANARGTANDLISEIQSKRGRSGSSRFKSAGKNRFSR